MHTKIDAGTHAWWSGTLKEFFATPDALIVGQLSACALTNYRANEPAQINAWKWQLLNLRDALKNFPEKWRLLLEYPLLRLSRRLDTVLLTDRAIFVIEYKALNSHFSQTARIQAEDYAYDLRDFHAGSRDKIIIPIVVAAQGNPIRPQDEFPWPGVSNVYEAVPENLNILLSRILSKISPGDLDIDQWETAPYRPVPTIIEAAKALYERHGVEDIKSARADTTNLSKTTSAILSAISDAKANSRHIILFVTGIPGAGKTLCGLDAIFSNEQGGTFLTGTLPMVYVLKAALATDASKKNSQKLRNNKHKTKAKIESVVGFLRDKKCRWFFERQHDTN